MMLWKRCVVTSIFCHHGHWFCWVLDPQGVGSSSHFKMNICIIQKALMFFFVFCLNRASMVLQETESNNNGTAPHSSWRNYDDLNEYFWYLTHRSVFSSSLYSLSANWIKGAFLWLHSLHMSYCWEERHSAWFCCITCAKLSYCQSWLLWHVHDSIELNGKFLSINLLVHAIGFVTCVVQIMASVLQVFKPNSSWAGAEVI